MHTMHNDEPYYCNSCDFESHDENTIQKHVYEVHNPTNQRRTFTSQSRRSNLKPRETSKQNGQADQLSARPKHPAHVGRPQHQFTCEDCEIHFAEGDHFKLHMDFYHGTQQ